MKSSKVTQDHTQVHEWQHPVRHLFSLCLVAVVALTLGESASTAQPMRPRDFFLEAVSSGTRQCISPEGGMLDPAVQPEQTTVQFWNLPKAVAPGQTVHSAISYAWTGNYPNSVVYKTVLAEWQTNSPIAVLENGELQGAPRTVRKDFSFTAPTTPGVYRMRFAMTWAYQGIQHFYGDGPAGDSSHPGVGNYAEVTYQVAETDSDGDNLPDSWELDNFANLSQTALDDPDQDNWTNTEELANGTGPNTFDIGPTLIWTAVEFGWRSVVGRNYQVQTFTSPNGPWHNFGSVVAGTGSTMTILDSTRSTGQKFYRVIVTP